MHVFERGMHHSSVRIAKTSESLLVSDRVQCQPDTYDHFVRRIIPHNRKIHEDNRR